MSMHVLKIWSEYFKAIVSGEKTCEIRFDDRGFTKGDTVLLQEVDADNALTGMEFSAEITHITRAIGLQKGYVALSLKSLMVLVLFMIAIQPAHAWHCHRKINHGLRWLGSHITYVIQEAETLVGGDPLYPIWRLENRNFWRKVDDKYIDFCEKYDRTYSVKAGEQS